MQHNSAYISPVGEEKPQQFAALLFLVRMLLGELRRASPGNPAIRHTEDALEEMEISPVHAPESEAVRVAKQTLRYAEQTVTEVQHFEEGKP